MASLQQDQVLVGQRGTLADAVRVVESEARRTTARARPAGHRGPDCSVACPARFSADRLMRLCPACRAIPRCRGTHKPSSAEIEGANGSTTTSHRLCPILQIDPSAGVGLSPSPNPWQLPPTELGAWHGRASWSLHGPLQKAGGRQRRASCVVKEPVGFLRHHARVRATERTVRHSATGSCCCRSACVSRAESGVDDQRSLSRGRRDCGCSCQEGAQGVPNRVMRRGVGNR